MGSVLWCAPLNFDHYTVCEVLRHQDTLSYYTKALRAKGVNQGGLDEPLGVFEAVNYPCGGDCQRRRTSQQCEP